MYHDVSSGCKLTVFKPPVCIGHICYKLGSFLKDKYGQKAKLFLDSMADVCYKVIPYDMSDLSPEDWDECLFFHFDRAIFYGRELVEIKKQNMERKK